MIGNQRQVGQHGVFARSHRPGGFDDEHALVVIIVNGDVHGNNRRLGVERHGNRIAVAETVHTDVYAVIGGQLISGGKQFRLGRYVVITGGNLHGITGDFGVIFVIVDYINIGGDNGGLGIERHRTRIAVANAVDADVYAVIGGQLIASGQQFRLGGNVVITGGNLHGIAGNFDIVLVVVDYVDAGGNDGSLGVEGNRTGVTVAETVHTDVYAVIGGQLIPGRQQFRLGRHAVITSRHLNRVAGDFVVIFVVIDNVNIGGDNSRLGIESHRTGIAVAETVHTDVYAVIGGQLIPGGQQFRLGRNAVIASRHLNSVAGDFGVVLVVVDYVDAGGNDGSLGVEGNRTGIAVAETVHADIHAVIGGQLIASGKQFHLGRHAVITSRHLHGITGNFAAVFVVVDYIHIDRHALRRVGEGDGRGGAVAIVIHAYPGRAVACAVVAGHQAVVGVHGVIARGDGGGRRLNGLTVLIHIINGHRDRHRHRRGQGGRVRLRGNIQAELVDDLAVCIQGEHVKISAAKIGRVGILQERQRRAAGRRKRRVLHERIADFQRGVGCKRICRHVQPVAAFIAGLGHFNGERLHGRVALHPGEGKAEGRFIAGERGEGHVAKQQHRGDKQRAESAQRNGGMGHNGASFGASSEDTKIMFQLYYETVLSSMNRTC